MCTLAHKQDANDDPLSMLIMDNMPDVKINKEMTKLWYIGHVISSSSGFHEEYGPDDLLLPVMLDIYRLLFSRALEKKPQG